MVARISTGRSIKSAVHYNETKCAEGKASLIMSSRFGCDADDLSVRQKIARFQALISKNGKVKTNTLHISLNFAPGERLSPSTLQFLAGDYMQRIGFADQPFLVYQHYDAGHPHIHIVTTNVQANGRAISMHNIGRLKSEPARKAIEQVYGLVVAEGRRQREQIPPALSPVTYGMAETKQAISNIVREVTSNFQYTTLEELNAALRCFNVVADRGRPGSRCWDRGGLIYSITDAHGSRIGVPVPASRIYGRPVLRVLERKMAANRMLGIYKRQRFRRLVDQVLATRSPAEARMLLARHRITCLPGRENGQADFFLIDHINRTVISLRNEGYQVSDLQHKLSQGVLARGGAASPSLNISIDTNILLASAGLLRELTTDVQPNGEYLPADLLRKKKRRRNS